MVFDAIRKYKEGVPMIRNSDRRPNRNRKRDEIMKIGYDGLPQLFKILKWNTPEVNGREDPYHLEFIPIYKRCTCCSMALGRIEEECSLMMGGYCIECFKNVTEQLELGIFGEFACPEMKCLEEVSHKDHTQIIPKQSGLHNRRTKNGRL